MEDSLNTDGAGIAYDFNAESAAIFKSGARYTLNGYSWMQEYNGGPLIGHVRNASYGTEISQQSAHPFYFRDSDRDGVIFNLVGVHNGAFPQAHTLRFTKSVNSDSWKAFAHLSVMIKDFGVRLLKADLFEEWLSDVGVNASFAVVISVNDTFYILRNDKRMLYAAPYEDGLLVNTDRAVLQMGLEYSHARYLTKNTSDQIVLMPSSVLYTVKEAAGSIVDAEHVICPAPVVTTTTHTSYYNEWSSISSTGTPEVRTTNSTFPDKKAETRVEKKEEKQPTVDLTVRTTLTSTDIQAAYNVWATIRTSLAPLSDVLCGVWLAIYLNVRNEEGHPHISWAKCTADDLLGFKAMLHMRRATIDVDLDANPIALLGAYDTPLVETWNGAVHDNELEIYVSKFGVSTWFLDMNRLVVKQVLHELMEQRGLMLTQSF